MDLQPTNIVNLEMLSSDVTKMLLSLCCVRNGDKIVCPTCSATFTLICQQLPNPPNRNFSTTFMRACRQCDRTIRMKFVTEAKQAAMQRAKNRKFKACVTKSAIGVGVLALGIGLGLGLSTLRSSYTKDIKVPLVHPSSEIYGNQND